MEILQGVWKQHLRPRAVVGYGVKIFPPSPPNYVTRSPGNENKSKRIIAIVIRGPPRRLSFLRENIFYISRHN